jgi:hypothetical protein
MLVNVNGLFLQMSRRLTCLLLPAVVAAVVAAAAQEAFGN